MLRPEIYEEVEADRAATRQALAVLLLRADIGELLRTIGFATAPGILRIFGLVPGLGVPMVVISAVWMLAAMIVAVRQALDFTSTGRAVAVCGLGWLFAVGFAVLFGLFFGPRVS